MVSHPCSVPRVRALAVVACVIAARLASAEPVTRELLPGQSIQAAIDAAADGDVLELAAGSWVEDVDFRGKAITLLGRGPETVLRGTGAGPVVTFASGETAASVLDAVTITGGVAQRGGGVFVDGASPTLLRNRIVRNRAHRQGSGIYLGAPSAAHQSGTSGPPVWPASLRVPSRSASAGSGSPRSIARLRTPSR